MALRVGQKAPPFDVVASNGKRLRLEDYLGTKNVVLYFYPGDFTPVCTKEACGFRDIYDDLASHDTEVIGVSLDEDASHERFVKEHRLPFSLVSDEKKTLTHAYAAASLFRNLIGKNNRITYVIDKKGVIAGVFDSELRASKHIDGVKELIAKLPA